MGSSVLLVFLAPFFAIYVFFVGIFNEFAPQPQAEIVLPYNESQGLVWEYVEDEDYYINLLEVKVEGDKQIFVFEADQSTSTSLVNIFSVFFEPTEGYIIDLAFVDQNGNIKTFYHDPRQDAQDPFIIYDESECMITEYTVTATDPEHADYWQVDFDGDNNIVRQPWVEDESAVTIVFMPYKIEDMENGENRIIRFTNNYWVDNTEYIEEYRVTFSVQNGQLVIVDEYWELDEK